MSEKVFYNMKNKVQLFTKDINIDQPFKKVNYKMIGFFEVIGQKKILLKLQFLQAMKIYNVFHPNLLKESLTDMLIDQINELLILIITNNRNKQEIKDSFNIKNY